MNNLKKRLVATVKYYFSPYWRRSIQLEKYLSVGYSAWEALIQVKVIEDR